MPGWPAVGRTDDQQLLEALRRTDAAAPASLYDSYAERLNDYAYALLGDRDGAAEAVHDALVTAHGCVDRLPEPARLRPWLYALTRSRCAAGTPGSRGPRGPAAAPDSGDYDTPEERELAALVHETLAELSGPEREVLELSLRHDLGTGEAGAVLGLTSRQATTRLGHAREHLENSAAAVILAKVGRAHCPDLSAMVDSWEGPLTTILRRRLSGHISRCEVCLERRKHHVSADRLLAMVPMAFPPLSLRRRVIETCVNPGRAGERAAIVEAGGRFDRTGFPTAADRRGRGRRAGSPPRRRRPSRRTAPVIAAVACVLAAVGAMAVITGRDAGGGQVTRAEAAPDREPALITLEPGPEPSPPEPSPSDPEPSPTATPAGERKKEVGKTGSPAPARSTPARRPVPTRPRATRAPAPPPPAGRLAVSCPTDIGEGAGTIRLSARNAAVSWSATTSGGLNVHPQHGRLKAGASGVIWVTAADPGESGSGRVAFKSVGGNSSCAISWETAEPEVTDPPEDPPPLPTSTPTSTPSSTFGT
ncbi:RNA polymerase sigma factor [Streptosporangium sp. NBC_01639]|uniref:RNA polymerase sigma factor n=1 Tax=Streptosporangium sp. NBC_01639 TaxID=2975948 RepID=UPI00386F367B|nr:RNA polymerase sigma factor [Streptosporangium sp. NBC_01639]